MMKAVRAAAHRHSPHNPSITGGTEPHPPHIVDKDQGTIFKLIAVAAGGLFENDIKMHAGEEHGMLLEEFADEVGKLRSDSFGRDKVFYY